MEASQRGTELTTEGEQKHECRAQSSALGMAGSSWSLRVSFHRDIPHIAWWALLPSPLSDSITLNYSASSHPHPLSRQTLQPITCEDMGVIPRGPELGNNREDSCFYLPKERPTLLDLRASTPAPGVPSPRGKPLQALSSTCLLCTKH